MKRFQSRNFGWHAVGLLIFACLLLVNSTGCGNDDASQAPKSAQAAKMTIAVIPKGTTHEFWKSIHAGAVKASRELNVDIVWKGPLKEDDREDQIKVVEDFVTRGVNGIVL